MLGDDKMAKIRIIKKNNDCSMEYEVGDICEVTGTWYGGVHINGRSGIPVSLIKKNIGNSTQNRKNLTVRKMKTLWKHRNTIFMQATLYSISKENGYPRILPNISIKSLQ